MLSGSMLITQGLLLITEVKQQLVTLVIGWVTNWMVTVWWSE